MKAQASLAALGAACAALTGNALPDLQSYETVLQAAYVAAMTLTGAVLGKGFDDFMDGDR